MVSRPAQTKVEGLTGHQRCNQALEKDQRNQEYLLPGGTGRLHGEVAEPKLTVWVKFKYRKMYERSLPGRRNRNWRGQSEKSEVGQVWDPEQAMLGVWPGGFQSG